jgi:hypothetical protein
MRFSTNRIPFKALAGTGQMFALTALLTSESLAQAKPPTPYELFNLRTACLELGEKLLAKLPTRKGIEKTQSAHYNPKINRCYVEVYFNSEDMGKPGFRSERILYDGQTTELLAGAIIDDKDKISDGKSGHVKDPKRQKTTDSNRGWDDANFYIDQLLEENEQ